MKKKLPKSIRKHIRGKKNQFQREVLDPKEQERLISQLYKNFQPKSKTEKSKKKKAKE